MRPLRWMTAPTLCTVVAVLILSAVGLQREFAWGWALLIAAVVVLLRIRMPEDPRADAPGRAAGQNYIGSDVSRLAWSVEPRTGKVTEMITRRVRATLARRLARVGVDVEDETQRQVIAQWLDGDLWDRLSGREVTVKDIREALNAAERLLTEQPGALTQRSHAEALKESEL